MSRCVEMTNAQYDDYVNSGGVILSGPYDTEEDCLPVCTGLTSPPMEFMAPLMPGQSILDFGG